MSSRLSQDHTALSKHAEPELKTRGECSFTQSVTNLAHAKIILPAPSLASH